MRPHPHPSLIVVAPVAVVCACWVSISAAPQAPPHIEALMTRIGERVAGYYRQAQRVICIEKSTVQPIQSNWTAEGFARTVESELRIEPETADGRALSARLAGTPQCIDTSALESPLARLDEAWRVEQTSQAVERACRALVRELAGTATAPEPSDARVLSAIAHIVARIHDAPSLEEVASLVHLSPSRFRHLFVAETGMPMRTYVLWRRLLHVWSLLMRGETLTSAAHAAGFADSAHLSRTARAMFGLPPSVLQMKGPLSARMREAGGRLG